MTNNKNKMDYKLVDTAGQITAVVFSEIKGTNISTISTKLMSSDKLIEQVVFIEKNQIQTMGNELCINGSFAGAYLLNYPILKISGLKKPIKFTKTKNFISADFPKDLVIKTDNNIIILQGIVYLVSNDESKINKSFLANLANKYNQPASGIIKYNQNKIIPIVYVRDTNSLVWENSCSSGSLAYSIYSNFTKLIQPSKQSITIKKNLKSFTIKVPVKIVK